MTTFLDYLIQIGWLHPCTELNTFINSAFGVVAQCYIV
jgi:hypothetical protein